MMAKGAASLSFIIIQNHPTTPTIPIQSHFRHLSTGWRPVMYLEKLLLRDSPYTTNIIIAFARACICFPRRLLNIRSIGGQQPNVAKNFPGIYRDSSFFTPRLGGLKSYVINLKCLSHFGIPHPICRQASNCKSESPWYVPEWINKKNQWSEGICHDDEKHDDDYSSLAPLKTSTAARKPSQGNLLCWHHFPKLVWWVHHSL